MKSLFLNHLSCDFKIVTKVIHERNKEINIDKD